MSGALSLCNLHACMAWTGVYLKVLQDGGSMVGAAEIRYKDDIFGRRKPLIVFNFVNNP
jgi:hypothetical protein